MRLILLEIQQASREKVIEMKLSAPCYRKNIEKVSTSQVPPWKNWQKLEKAIQVSRKVIYLVKPKKRI